MNRRSFFKSFGLFSGVAVFTPKLIAVSWRDTLRYGPIRKFHPHWACLNDDWILVNCLYASYCEGQNDERLKAWINRTLVRSSVDHIYLSQPWHEQMYESMIAPDGSIVKPLIHMPRGFNPPPSPAYPPRVRKPETDFYGMKDWRKLGLQT